MFSPNANFGGWRIHESSQDNTLIIAIDNTSARFDEYTQVQDMVGSSVVGGKASDYADVIWTDIRPFIEGQFGTPSKRGILGSSLGGLVSLYAAKVHPFDFAASLSGTVGWGSVRLNNATLINDAAAGQFDTPVIYLDSGGGPGGGCFDADQDGNQDDGSGSDNYCETRQLANILAAQGYVWDDSLYHFWQQGAGHNESAWRDRVWRPLEIFANL